MLALAEHPFTCICLFLHESALAFHLCLIQQDTSSLSHGLPNKTPSNTTVKEPLCFHFTSESFSYGCCWRGFMLDIHSLLEEVEYNNELLN
jgi:hypothetical protein